MGDMGKGVLQIAFMFGSIGLIGLILSHSSDAAKVINSTGKTFAGVLAVSTLQSNYSNLFSM